MPKERTQKQINASEKLVQRMKTEAPEDKKARLDKARETREKNKAIKKLKAETEAAIKASDNNIEKVKVIIEKGQIPGKESDGRLSAPEENDDPMTTKDAKEYIGSGTDDLVGVWGNDDNEEVAPEIDDTMAPVSQWQEPVTRANEVSIEEELDKLEKKGLEKPIRGSRKVRKRQKIIYYSESETDSDTEIIYEKKKNKKDLVDPDYVPAPIHIPPPIKYAKNPNARNRFCSGR